MIFFLKWDKSLFVTLDILIINLHGIVAKGTVFNRWDNIIIFYNKIIVCIVCLRTEQIWLKYVSIRLILQYF